MAAIEANEVEDDLVDIDADRGKSLSFDAGRTP
jgi:hypothetical protein